jgi:preprotein translocase subunit SecA
MTGTATTESAELMNTYDLQVVPIPTNMPVIRDDAADLIYKGELGKFDAVVDDIESRYETGQPVLVGTVSVAKSEYLASLLVKRGIPHQVLNAKQHTREALVVAQAGRLGAVTVATNMAGRGVDITLGGNPEGLAREEVLKEGHAPDTLVEEFNLAVPVDQLSEEERAARVAAQARYGELLERFKDECGVEGDKIRELGGLYVLGTERHESRRIDNQLRGRSGRQGDPGESRFYLSLDDELMRLFATGALQWVMGKTLPDDAPIEAKMVTKAIERAQNTVEQRNGEIRKNVLKYDEVMNEQRKVIYRRRDQILAGADLRTEALEYLDDAVRTTIEAHCVAEVPEEWDLDGLQAELQTFYPSTITAEQLAGCTSTDAMQLLVMEEAEAYYQRREDDLTPEVMREVERQVMLQIIDQRWREHLQEMDYLQEGINLRAMGQRDPLVEWQREGFEMFGQLMHGIAQDFVRYVMHVQVVQPAAETAAPAVQNVATHSSEDVTTNAFQAAAQQALADGEPLSEESEPTPSPARTATATAPARPTKQQTVVNDEWAKTGRNEPCPCGSGKKYKLCHGR